MSAVRHEKEDDSVRVLERLRVLCSDGAKGYRHAAAAVQEPHRLHRILAHSAAQREEVESVLTNALVTLGYKPDHHGSVLGLAHRGLIDAALVFSPSTPSAVRAILHECERGERMTIEAFASALGRSLPANVLAIIQSQLGRVLETSAALRLETLSFDDPQPSAGG